MATPKRRYPTSLSHNPAGPSRPQRPISVPSSSIDDEVPTPPSLSSAVPNQPLPELSSLELLLRQAGYKETRVFTPEAERTRPRLKRHFDDEGPSELANLYATMGLDPNSPLHVQHATKPAFPIRSSSSVLRNVALQDATAMLNEIRRRRGDEPYTPEMIYKQATLRRAAAEVGKSVAAMSPPRDGSLDSTGVGLRLAKNGQAVRKAKSNYELSRQRAPSPQQEDIPPPRQYHEEPPRAAPPRYPSAFSREVPPSIANMFSPPEPAAPISEPHFDDEAFGFSPLDYEAQEDEDMYMQDDYGFGDDDSYATTSSPSSSLRLPSGSPPLLNESAIMAELGFANETDLESIADDDEIAAAEQQAHEIGQRILASTVEYDEDSDSDFGSPRMEPVPLPAFEFQSPTPPRSRKVTSPADGLAQAMADPLPLPFRVTSVAAPAIVAPQPTPEKKLRAAKSAPALRHSKSRAAPLRISPAIPAPPAVQAVAPVICDSISNEAEDLPPIPSPPPEAVPASNGITSFAVKARKSLSALRAAFWGAEPAPVKAEVQEASSGNTTPILSPRLDWQAQGMHFAGWNDDSEEKSSKSRATVKPASPPSPVDDPFDDKDIDYTKSFFYKPSTPPRPDGSYHLTHRPRKQSSIKSLREHLLKPVAAPPVPPLPAQYRKSMSSISDARTPPRTPRRLVFPPPQLCVQSPGAFEEGRPPRPLVLDGEEWEGHEVVVNWGKGIRKGKGKGKRNAARRSRLSDSSDSSSSGAEVSSSPTARYCAH